MRMNASGEITVKCAQQIPWPFQLLFDAILVGGSIGNDGVR